MLKKISKAYLLLLLTPAFAFAQTSVFKCVENGHTVWSEYPCKSKGTTVKVKPVTNGKQKNAQGVDASKPADKATGK
ncbi:DUF4124 domain-containing protein [Undibacterium sp. SXout11W]|uniref:DUF4124 domain-containing protein n=1 Tax=Undibacterium sp. SXout11W TaxID=3413050 RepID=UPI003BF3C727